MPFRLMRTFCVRMVLLRGSLSRYLAAAAAALPVTAVYAGSNVIFLLVLAKPIGEKIRRVIEKYGV